MNYDVIGDIHGHADKLTALLRKLDYEVVCGVWRHPERTAVFVGDFIDRGPAQVETYRLARAMVEDGGALAVMGNHELNAIAYFTSDGRGGHLRAHSEKNQKQHRAFLDEVSFNPALHAEIIQWFLTLPLWLDLPEIRVVHACWDDALMQAMAYELPGQRLAPELLARATQGHSNSYGPSGERPSSDVVFQCVETLTKGVEADLPAGVSFLDKDGHERRNARMQWWRRPPATFREAGIMSSSERHKLPDLAVPDAVLPGYDHPKPLFFGHYWMTDVPRVITDKVACVDYSAGRDGPLVAYRYSGEDELTDTNFVASTA